MKLLDLYCGAGGAGKGYKDAGFDVTGIDIVKPSYYGGNRFVQGDALEYLWAHGTEYDLIHSSPPCQHYSQCKRLQDGVYEGAIEQTREVLQEIDKPYVIENVHNAPLIKPVELCGCMFPKMRTYRERLFECSFPVKHLGHNPHIAKTTKMGRKPKPDEFVYVVGNFSGVKEAHAAMRIGWMTNKELAEAIPPPYTQYIGEEFRRWAYSMT